MKILVTGGAGFIASHVTDRFIADGHEVAVLDNLSSGRRENLNPAAVFYEGNIRDKDLVEEIFARHGFDIVDHHAAQMDVRKSALDPEFDALENIVGSLNIIMASVRHGVKKIVYASTGGAVYGEPDYRPVREDHPVNPLSQYGISKHTVEHYLHLYWMQHCLEYTALRYPNVFGERQSPRGEAGVVAIFTGQLLAGEQPTIFGDGGKTRDYMHVSDVVGANVAALGEAGNHMIMNIGTGVETSDRQIYDGVAAAVGSDMLPAFADVRPGEINRISLDASKAREVLGWAPRLGFQEGLQRTVDYIREHGA